MVRPPSVDSSGMKKGAWSEDEDNKLRAYVLRYGHWNWRLLPKYAGLARCGKSCRLRWVNYLKPGVKKGNFTKEEEDLIIQLHAHLGNKWSTIATKLPGRTDNEIKNFYHTRIEKNRKRNPSSKKIKHPASEASDKDQALEGEKAFKFSQSQETTGDESSISEATSLESIDNTIPPHEITQSKVDIFQIDTNYNQTDSFPPFIVDHEFEYPELHYSELSFSDSSYRSALDWIADDNVALAPSSLWGESSASNYQNQSPTGFYDPLFQECFDYQMDLFS